MDLHNDQPGATAYGLYLNYEVPWPGKIAGGVAVIRPPLRCQRHRTRSPDRVVVLHDPLRSAAPAPPWAVASAMPVPFPSQRHRTRTPVYTQPLPPWPPVAMLLHE
jgi:hypothetical protein